MAQWVQLSLVISPHVVVESLAPAGVLSPQHAGCVHSRAHAPGGKAWQQAGKRGSRSRKLLSCSSTHRKQRARTRGVRLYDPSVHPQLRASSSKGPYPRTSPTAPPSEKQVFRPPQWVVRTAQTEVWRVDVSYI